MRLGVSLLFASISCSPSGRAACPATPRAHVVVHAAAHELALCERGQAVRRFGVRLAKGGTGKTREGDEKLPLGRYPLGDAVASDRFGLFLPIGYPTPEQRARGMTGGAVGVHGPARGARFLGPLVNTFDTTDGCVGLATDDEVRAVAEFVRSRRAHVIVIE